MIVVLNLVFGAIVPVIDNSAHVGGLITGLIVGALIARFAPQRDTPGRAAIFAVVILVLAISAAAAAHYYHLPLRFGRSPFAVVR
jgi:rhomboid protease GluP